jgi:hypothetical protein
MASSNSSHHELMIGGAPMGSCGTAPRFRAVPYQSRRAPRPDPDQDGKGVAGYKASILWGRAGLQLQLRPQLQPHLVIPDINLP